MTRLRIMVPICRGPIQEAIIHIFTTFRRGVSRVITQEEMITETRAGEDLQMSRHKDEDLMNNMVRGFLLILRIPFLQVVFLGIAVADNCSC